MSVIATASDKCDHDSKLSANRGPTPTPWARGLRDQIQKKGAPDRQSFKHRVLQCSEGD